MPNTNLRMIQRQQLGPSDEFFTPASTVELELSLHTEALRGHPILFNCNDWNHPGFLQCFLSHPEWGWAELIATGFTPNGQGVLARLKNNGGGASFEDFTVSELDGTGGWDTPECERLLDIPDVIVCTNPPFSQVKNFIPRLLEKHVGFAVVVPLFAIAYSKILPAFLDGRCWVGPTGELPPVFLTPSGKEEYISNARWITNLPGGEEQRRRLHTVPVLEPFDDDPALNTSRVADVPLDFGGELGVPITFFDFLSPNDPDWEITRFLGGPRQHGKKLFKRVVVRRKQQPSARL